MKFHEPKLTLSKQREEEVEKRIERRKLWEIELANSQAEKNRLKIEKDNIRLITLKYENYPQYLKEIKLKENEKSQERNSQEGGDQKGTGGSQGNSDNAGSDSTPGADGIQIETDPGPGGNTQDDNSQGSVG